MNLTITNSTCEDIIYNGHYLEKLYFNEDLVWEKIHHDYSQDYFTMEALENGTVGWHVVGRAASVWWAGGTYFYWSKDDGSTWNLYDNSQIPVNAGDKVLWKRTGRWSCGDNNNIDGTGTSSDWWYKNVTRVETTCKYKVYGNIQSLWWGDNFIGETSMRPDWHKNNNNVYDWSYGICKGMFNEKWTGNITITVGGYEDPDDIFAPGYSLPEVDNSLISNNLDRHYLVDAKNLVIPFSHVGTRPDSWQADEASQSFAFMFANCLLLEHGPKMTSPDYVGSNDYYAMFAECKRLKDFKCNFDCYMYRDSYNGFNNFRYMFANCWYLEQGPDIIRAWCGKTYKSRPNYDYYLGEMRIYDNDNTFYACQSLKKAPALYARSFIPSSGSVSFAKSTNNGIGMFAWCRSLEDIKIFVCGYKSSSTEVDNFPLANNMSYIRNNNKCKITTNTNFYGAQPSSSNFTVTKVDYNGFEK